MTQSASHDAIHSAARVIRTARHVVALTGAGLSAESGIPTYRGDDGVWTRFSEPTIDGWDLFCGDPAGWWREAIAAETSESPFRQALDVAEPNPGHIAMAQLEQMGRLHHVITQNIDGLHAKAGTTALTEIHGNRRLTRCMECGLRTPTEEVSLEALPPLCGECQGVLKNDVVMFGEPIPERALRECDRQAHTADVFLVVGTSAVVYPAASFPILAKRGGAIVIEVNPNETELSPIADLVIRKSSGDAMPAIVEALGVP